MSGTDKLKNKIEDLGGKAKEAAGTLPETGILETKAIRTRPSPTSRTPARRSRTPSSTDVCTADQRPRELWSPGPSSCPGRRPTWRTAEGAGCKQRRGREIAMAEAERDAFLNGERTCRVATIGRDGPHATPLWFVWDAGLSGSTRSAAVSAGPICGATRVSASWSTPVTTTWSYAGWRSPAGPRSSARCPGAAANPELLAAGEAVCRQIFGSATCSTTAGTPGCGSARQDRQLGLP